jgi:chromosome segregation ATPase
MNLAEAVSHAERMKNFFRAFQHLEEVLSLARNQENQVTQRQTQLDKLTAAITAGQQEVATQNQRITDAQKEVLAAELLAKETTKNARAEAEKTLKQIRENTAAEITRLENELEEARKRFKAELLDIAEQSAKKRGEIIALNEQIEGLKNAARKVLA